MMNNIAIGNLLIRKELIIKSDRIIGFKIINPVTGRAVEGLDTTEEFIFTFKRGLRKYTVKASELKIKDFRSDVEGEVSKHTITFSPFGLKDNRIEATLVYLLNDFRGYIRKYIELRYVKRGKKDVLLDSISFENFTFDCFDIIANIFKINLSIQRIHSQYHNARNDHYNTDYTVQCLCVRLVGNFCGNTCPKQSEYNTQNQAKSIRKTSDYEMADAPSQSSESHNEHTRAHCHMSRISKKRCKNK